MSYQLVWFKRDLRSQDHMALSEAPAAEETFLNVGALNAKIAGMLVKINQLEEALKAKNN